MMQPGNTEQGRDMSLQESSVGSLITAVLETAGMGLQSDMLDLFSSTEGQLIAGLFYLFVIVSAITAFALFGSYQWVRYLLVGPALFFFLTEVRIPNDPVHWKFGDKVYKKEMTGKMLQGVMDYAEGGNRTAGSKTDVSFFFATWNWVVTDIIGSLVSVVGTDTSGSSETFINKVERYMGFWNENWLGGEVELNQVINFSLRSECSDYFKISMIVNDPTTDLLTERHYKKVIEDRGITVAEGATKEELQKAINDAIKEQGWWVHMSDISADPKNKLYQFVKQDLGLDASEPINCQRMWVSIVKYLKIGMAKKIKLALNPEDFAAKNPNDTTTKVSAQLRAFIEKMYTETARSGSMTRFHSYTTNQQGQVVLDLSGGSPINTDELLKDPKFEAGLQRAIDWIVARSLFKAIWTGDPRASSFNFEERTGARNVQSRVRDFYRKDRESVVNHALHHNNQIETYRFKNDFLAGALSLPHYQGFLMLLLAAGFPFFALFVLIPGRSGAVLTWMGLWVWVKSWDFGMAIVLMIDDILYAVFPRGPALQAGDIDIPGSAWHRVMQVDPGYSAATYYNIIGTCLYAIPFVTGFMVKAGGKEFINMFHQTWSGHAKRLSTGSQTFKRVLVFESYSKRMEDGLTGYTNKEMLRIKPQTDQMLQQQKELTAMSEVLKAKGLKALRQEVIGLYGEKSELAKIMGVGTGITRDLAQQYFNEHIQMIDRNRAALIDLTKMKAGFNYSTLASGSYASQQAVKSRYFNHGYMHAHHGRAEFKRDLAKFYDAEKIVAKQVGEAELGGFLQFSKAVSSALAGGAK